jgi:hemerythrin-like domain-containing protein
MKASAVLEKVRRLESEHGQAGVMHDEAEQLYTKWIAEGGLSADEEMRLLTIAEELQRLYREHIHIEEDVVFPAAEKLFDHDAVTAMGSEFRIRRERT